MSIASDTFTLIGVLTCLEEIEVGAEVEIPGLDYTVIVRDIDTAARRTDDGGRRLVVVLTYYRHDGARATYEDAKLAQIRRFLPLNETKLRASYGELSKDETCDLVPALVDEVARLRAELGTATLKLGESRRMRAMAEDIIGVRRPGGGS